MDKKAVRYPHIKLPGREDIFEKGYGNGGSKLSEGGINSFTFKNKLSEVLSVQDIRAKFNNKFFFEIDLRLEYYKPIPQNLFKQLGVEVRSTFGDKKVIVSGPEDTIRRYRQKSRFNNDFLRCIKDIKVLESSEKIGESIKINWDTHRKINVEIGFLDNISGHEREEFQKNIGSLSEKIKLGKFTSSAVASLSKNEIEELSEIAIVKRISEKPVWTATFLSKASGVGTPLKFNIGNSLGNLPPVCVIDTGVSKDLLPLCLKATTICEDVYDKNDHGTAISSMCMFNKRELASSTLLEPSVGIISHKISNEDGNNEINFFDELLYAINLHKDKTKIFCLSWNCDYYDEIAYEDRIKELDSFLQKNNILLVNSAGNLKSEEGRHLYPNYPKYLLENPVMTPSEGKYVLSVGSTHLVSEYITMLSSFGRLLLPMTVISKPEDLFIRIKPEVFAEGGFIKYGDGERPDIENTIICLNSSCLRIGVVGTSIAAPQVARIAALLQEHYRYKFVETLKSMTFLKCKEFKQEISRVGNNVTAYQARSLQDHSEILDADDGFYFFFENITKPHERIEEKKKDLVFAMSWEIPIVSEIEYVEFVISHSNSNPFEGSRSFSTRIVTSVHKPGKKGPLSKLYGGGYGTIGKKAPLVHGKYKYSKNTPEGMWKIKAYVETSGLPRTHMDKVEIRYGVAVKIRIKEEYINDKERIYAKVLKLLGKESSEYENIVIETIGSKIPEDGYVAV